MGDLALLLRVSFRLIPVARSHFHTARTCFGRECPSWYELRRSFAKRARERSRQSITNPIRAEFYRPDQNESVGRAPQWISLVFIDSTTARRARPERTLKKTIQSVTNYENFYDCVFFSLRPFDRKKLCFP